MSYLVQVLYTSTFWAFLDLAAHGARVSMNTPLRHNQKCMKESNALSHAIEPSSKPFTSFKCILFKESVIFIVITGFWWSCRAFPCAQAVGIVDEDDGNEHEPEEAPGQDGFHRDLAQVPSKLGKQSIRAMQEHPYSFNLNMFVDDPAEGAGCHTVLSEDRMSPSERIWLDYLLYGTAPSNQVLSLII